ncbi:MAG: light-regulated signal transduction histidine kinase (bacteriophytochrome) [Paracoccaceae bacterium]
MSNALKYHRTGVAPHIAIGALEHEQHEEFYVHDNGIGIDPAYHRCIFQPFKRLHSADEYTGSGVGRAICKKIVDAMGGSIRLESELGKDSCFYFSLRKPPAAESGTPPKPDLARNTNTVAKKAFRPSHPIST